MKLLRVRVDGTRISYIIFEGEVCRVVDMDPIDTLRKYRDHQDIELGIKINLDSDTLITGEVSGEKIDTPLDPPEIWGAGITYRIARARYSEEEVAMIGGKTIYELVYESERPELFFKDTGRRCVGYMDPISIRSDSDWTLPEPELGVVLDEDGSILGFTIVNDVSARDIEATNPLYLPQSKTFIGCCAFGPYIVTPDEIGDPHNLKIEMKIVREGEPIYHDETSTSRMAKSINTLIEYLLKDNYIPPGTLLMTGTGLVPGADISLSDGDVVEIVIEKIGTLVNPVVKL